MTSQTTHSAIYKGDTQGPDTEALLLAGPRSSSSLTTALKESQRPLPNWSQETSRAFLQMFTERHGAVAAGAAQPQGPDPVPSSKT